MNLPSFLFFFILLSIFCKFHFLFYFSFYFVFFVNFTFFHFFSLFTFSIFTFHFFIFLLLFFNFNSNSYMNLPSDPQLTSQNEPPNWPPKMNLPSDPPIDLPKWTSQVVNPYINNILKWPQKWVFPFVSKFWRDARIRPQIRITWTRQNSPNSGRTSRCPKRGPRRETRPGRMPESVRRLPPVGTGPPGGLSIKAWQPSCMKVAAQPNLRHAAILSNILSKCLNHFMSNSNQNAAWSRHAGNYLKRPELLKSQNEYFTCISVYIIFWYILCEG